MNKYQKWYDKIIARAKNRVLCGYFEFHHITPLCVGGSDDDDNLVALTAEEHYVCHQLLIKIYPGNRKIVFAANMMCVGNTDAQRPNNKTYAWLRKKLKDSLSHQRSNSFWINKDGKNKWVSSDKINEFINNGWERGMCKGRLSEEWKEKIRKSRNEKYKLDVDNYYKQPLKCHICGDVLPYQHSKARDERLKRTNGKPRCKKTECNSITTKKFFEEKRLNSPPKEASYSSCQCCGGRTNGKKRKYCSQKCHLKVLNESKRKSEQNNKAY